MKHLRRAIQRLMRLNEGKKRRANAPSAVLGKVDLAVKIPTTYQAAATSLTDWNVCKSVNHKNRLVKTSRDQMHPRMVEFYVKFSKELERRGIPMYAFEFYRTPERQAVLKAQGVSKAAPGSSPHQYGCAVDIVHSTKLWDITNKQWFVIGAIGKEVARKMNLKIRWGGDWDQDGVPVIIDGDEHFWDPAHWEIEDWRDYRRIMQDFPYKESARFEPLLDDKRRYYEHGNYGDYMMFIGQQLKAERKAKRVRGQAK